MSSGVMRVEIETLDRPYMTYDILRIFVEFEVNIIWMEVYTHVVYIKFDPVSDDRWKRMRDAIGVVPGVKGLRDIGLIAFEQREQLIGTILETSGTGILVIGADGVVRLANRAARKLLREPEELEGRAVSEVISAQEIIREAIATGKGFSNQSLLFEKSGGVCHVLAEGRVMQNEAGAVEGLILTLSDMEEVRRMVHTLTRAQSITFAEIVTRSPGMQKLIDLAETIAQSDPTVLIRGESGTGKELFARAIHAASPRCGQAFVPLNCAAIPDTLIESELFGYDDGAFTGARRGGKQGLFELANGGTLFLDEVGELTPYVQAKLLRVLQEGRVRRVGGSREISVDVRIIAATNRDLEQMCRQGNFREDLYYRLHVIPLFIPPLRSHPEDIPLLAEHFCRRLGQKLGRDVTTDSGAIARLEAYAWPGNVREMSNAIERAAYLAAGRAYNGKVRITAEHIMLDTPIMGGSQTHTVGHSLQEAVTATELKMISAALTECGSIRGAARLLGVTHTLLINRMKKLNITFR